MAGPEKVSSNRFSLLFNSQPQGQETKEHSQEHLTSVTVDDVKINVSGRLDVVEGKLNKMAALSSKDEIQEAQKTIHECRETIAGTLQVEKQVQKSQQEHALKTKEPVADAAEPDEEPTTPSLGR